MSEKIFDQRSTNTLVPFIPQKIWYWILLSGNFAMTHNLWLIIFQATTLPTGIFVRSGHRHNIYPYLCHFAFHNSNIHNDRDCDRNYFGIYLACSCKSREQKYQTKTPCKIYHSAKYEKSEIWGNFQIIRDVHAVKSVKGSILPWRTLFFSFCHQDILLLTNFQQRQVNRIQQDRL